MLLVYVQEGTRAPNNIRDKTAADEADLEGGEKSSHYYCYLSLLLHASSAADLGPGDPQMLLTRHNLLIPETAAEDKNKERWRTRN